MQRTLFVSLVSVFGLAVLAGAQQPTSRVIRGMRYPAVSPDGSQIVFSYRGDLWTVSSAGGEAKRVAERAGWDVRARFSPDGKTIAFSSDAAGNMDLYTVPATGGEVKQITFHSADDVLSEWAPDGKSLVFLSGRDTRMPAVYSVGVEDGRLRELLRDDFPLSAPVLSPDGKLLAYARGRGDWARKGYRGSANTDLWVVALDRPGQMPRRLTTFAGNDLWPQFSPDGRSLYYTADPDGAGNLWRISVSGGKPTQVTRQREGYIHYPTLASTGKTLAYETDFSLWTVDPTARGAQPRRLTVSAAFEQKPRRETRNLGRAEELEVSPDGSTLAIGARGDIFLAPAAGGDARRVTDSLARDNDFDWSPDGRTLAYVSERDANQDIYLLDVATGASRRLTTSTEPEGSPQFSPDGRSIAFIRGNSGGEAVVTPVLGGSERVVVKGPFLTTTRWSPDGKWLAYSKRTEAAVTNVYVSPVAGGPEVNVSRWISVNTNPIWSPDGSRLFFFSSRSGSQDIYAVDLARGSRPVATAAGSGAPAAVAAPQVTIDPAGISKRVRPLPGAPAGTKLNLVFSPDRKSLLFTVAPGTVTLGRGRRTIGPGTPGGAVLYSLPLTGGGQPQKVAEGITGAVRLSPDGAAVYTYGFSGVRKIALPEGASSPVELKASWEVDLAEERREAFEQAWRLMRDSFYDPQMHGVSWDTIRSRYRPIVDETLDVKDFHLLLVEMVGELNASHTGASMATGPGGPGGRGGGGGGRSETASLGLWFDWNGSGPGLKVTEVLRDGPADTDDSRIRPGEYVLAVAGQDAAPTEAFLKTLAGKTGATVDVLVNDRPDKTGARTVKLAPINRGRFTDLLYDHWVEGNRERVERLSGGKLAYLHIRAMDQPSLERFDRELITEAYERQGVVLDVRNNGGGRIHDDLLAILTRKVHVFETPRGGLKMTQPFGAFVRPSILLINGSSFSDAEIFPNGYRANKLGKIVGVPTGGGVIGTSDQTLLDGVTRFRVPRTGWHTLDGRNLENWGVPPDIYVEMTPADYLSGQDPQLERAVQELLKQVDRK